MYFQVAIKTRSGAVISQMHYVLGAFDIEKVPHNSPVILGQIGGRPRTNCNKRFLFRILYYKVPTTSKKNPPKSSLGNIFFYNIGVT